jgi:hypothetical protein
LPPGNPHYEVVMSQGTTTDSVPCPRCQAPLIDPAGICWCKECGFCRSLLECELKTVGSNQPTKHNEITATGEAIGQTPFWVWVMIVGMVAVIGGTWAAGHYLRLAPLHRAILTSAEILGSVAILLLVQFIALMKIAPDDPTLTFKDAVIPFRLYALIFKRLPKMSFTVFIAVWCLTAIISANVFVGGVTHWLTYLPDSKKMEPGHKGALGR